MTKQVWVLHVSDRCDSSGQRSFHGLYETREVMMAALTELFPRFDVLPGLETENAIHGALSNPGNHPHLYYEARRMPIARRVPKQRRQAS